MRSEVSKSPYGPKDEIGRLNEITGRSRTKVLELRLRASTGSPMRPFAIPFAT